MTKQAKQVQGEVIPAGSIIGVDLQDGAKRAEAALMARQKFAKSGKARIIQAGEVDFAALGATVAEMVFGIEEEKTAAINSIKHQARISKGTAWLSAAMELPNASDPHAALNTLVESFGNWMALKPDYKRATVDKSEFRLFCLAYLVSPNEVMGVLDEHETDAEAMKELRSIRDTGKRRNAKEKSNAKRKPTEKQFANIIEAVGAMDTKQLSALFKAGQSRAKALRKKGEIFEAFR